MNGIGVAFFKVLFCFGVGASIPILISSLADLVSGGHTVRTLAGTIDGITVLIVFGLFGVTLAIWDGQFADDVKPTRSTRSRKSN
ncbi:MAG TPA: hypothetical protein VFW28_06645 [Micropepsaceae bacterium]|nr:hypothetical protein [Micropepsaceae bacterium]